MSRTTAKATENKLLKPDVLDLIDMLNMAHAKIMFLNDCLCQEGGCFEISPQGQTGLSHIVTDIADKIEHVENELNTRESRRANNG
jgi:hypothetical protein